MSVTSVEKDVEALTMTVTVRNGAGLTASTGNLEFTWVGRPPGP